MYILYYVHVVIVSKYTRPCNITKKGLTYTHAHARTHTHTHTYTHTHTK